MQSPERIVPSRVPTGRTWGIIWPFLVIVVLLVVLANMSLYIMSGARAFVTGESIWSKAQKEALYSLLHYSSSHREEDFQRFQRALEVAQGDRIARVEMDRPGTDYDAVRRGLAAARIHPDDMPLLIFLYRVARHMTFMERMIALWEEGDRYVDELRTVGERLHHAVSKRETGQKLAADIDRIYELDAQLTRMEYEFSDQVGAASRQISLVLILVTLGIAATLVPIGYLLARRIVGKGYAAERALRTSEERFHLAVAGSNDGIWDWDIASGRLYMSPRFKELLGYREEELDDHLASMTVRLHPNDADGVRRAAVGPMRRGSPLDLECRLRVRGGDYRWFRIRGQSVRNARGKAVRMVGSISDTTAYRLASDELHAEKERLRVTLEAIGDAVIAADNDGRIEYLNPAAELLTGWSEVDARGHPLEQVCMVIDEVERAPVLAELDITQHGGGRPTGSRHTILLARDGREIAVSAVTAPIRDESQRVRGILVVLRDVSQERQYAATLSHQASHDALTGLINRREFDHRLRLALDSAREHQRQHALLYLDLDQFKVVNDTCGHAAGDELIKQVSLLLRQRLREGDTLARLGGDEFGVLLENCPAEHAARIAEDLRRTMVEFRFAWNGQPFALGMSIGLVNVHDTALTPAAVLSTADSACYLAKEKGRNRVHVYRPDDDELSDRRGEMEWVGRIRDALETGAFRLYAQAIAPLRTNTEGGVHVELLVRMVDEQGKIIPPMAFIPAAQRYDLMTEIDRWVVKTAFATIQTRWLAGGEAARGLFAINLSGTSIGDERFLEFVLEQFVRYDIPFESVCFEVTETSAIANLAKATRFIGELQALGCRFALDDFGSGMSSFAYLKQLPVDYLKIDGAFVKDMLDDPMDRAMVEAINHIGHIMGKQTVAEFAENDAIIAELRRIGVDYAQGYGVARPVPFTVEADSTVGRPALVG